MKTLFFCNLIPEKLGAFEGLLAALGRPFREQGDQLAVVFAREPIPEVARALAAEGTRWHAIPGWSEGGGRERPWAFVLPALRLLRAEKPDVAVVHFGNELPSLAASLLAPLAGARRVKWVWQQDQQIRDPSGLARRLSRLRVLAARFDHFVAVYDGGRESLIRRGIPAERVSVVYNSIRAHRPSRAAGWLRRELGLPSDAVVAVSTAWMVRRKRLDFLLEAFARLPPGTAPLRLLLVGDGPERAALERSACRLGVAERVCFLGQRNDVRDILAEADLLVHASTAETCTYAVTEAMAAGVPAVMTEAGAAREQVLDGRSGYVLGRDDLEGFVGRIAALIGDPARRRAMGAAARDRWAERYRVEDAAAKYHALYKALAEEE